MSKLKIFLWLSAFFALNTYAQKIPAPDFNFYYVDGQKVPLVELKGLKALALPDSPDRLVNAMRRAGRTDTPRVLTQRPFENASLRQRRLPRLEQKYKTILLESKEGVANSTFDRSLDEIQRQIPGSSYSSVYLADGVWALLTDTFTVEFKNRMSDADATALLNRRLNFEFTLRADDLMFNGRRLPGREGRYKITINDDTTHEEALRQVNALFPKRPPEIDFFYPDIIFIHWAWMELKNMPPIDMPALPACDTARTGIAPDDPLYDKQWSLKNTQSNVDAFAAGSQFEGTPGADIGAEEAWTATKATGTIIAVIDVGVDPDHPDLVDVLLPGIDATEDGVTNPQPDPQYPEDRHGTQVAGLAAAKTDNCEGIAGVAWDAQILPVRFAEQGGEELFLFDPDAPGDAIDLAVAGGAKVLINAWFDQTGTASQQHMKNAVRRAITSNRVVVFSANNYSYVAPDCWNVQIDAITTKRYCNSKVNWPATLADDIDPVLRNGVIVVSATNQKDQFKTVGNYIGFAEDIGGNTSWGSRHGCAVSLSAPGLWMPTTDYATDSSAAYVLSYDGTSAAAPLVGGAAALLLTKYPNATPAQVKLWLQKGADPGVGQALDANGNHIWDEFYGAGRLNIKGALDAAEAEMSQPEVPGVPGGLDVQ
jgi:subtilisin family serine protease